MSHALAVWPSHRAVTAGAGSAGSRTGNKVPQLFLLFWVIKIAATTLGETGGDAASMSLGIGYAGACVIFIPVLAILLARQITARAFHPALFWSVVVATATAGTTMADFADRSLGIGYRGGATALGIALLAVLVTWRFVLGRIEADHIAERRTEAFYWLAILFSNTLGTSLGDFAASQPGVGFAGGAVVFSTMLLAIAAAWLLDLAPRVPLFWAAFVLTRPLGATLGDVLTKAHSQGGLAIDRFDASLALGAAVMIGAAAYPKGTRA